MSHNVGRIEYTQYRIDLKTFKIISFDRKFCMLTGYSRKEIFMLGLSQKDLLFEEDWDDYVTAIIDEYRKFLNPSSFSCFLEHRVKRKDGTGFFAICYGKTYYNDENKRIEVLILATDISNTIFMKHQKEDKEKILDAATKDSLTGIYNRGTFEMMVRHLLSEKPNNKKFAMIMVDLNDFKNYNDTFGHIYGDIYIKKVAYVLNYVCSKNEICARMGGDEFAVFIRGIDERYNKLEFYNKFSASFKNMELTKTEKKYCGFSMGIAYGKYSAGFDKYYISSDKALYRAKKTGKKNSFCIYEKEI
ncbi:MAG: diguanylate cyclase [Clostridia bacterium]|nr:diguanylate cyclase [Clostridia bacterium]MCI2001196.1 diguanylate cyclase [Clostridia bacterium]MCI2015886.1 diguanylate cyclase [Clostridia bacterium]